jgi:hypothetical protein
MDVKTAKAQLALAEAEEKYLAQKAAYHAIPRDERTDKQKAAFHKAQQDFAKVRDNWRLNFRTAPSGPGDATVSPKSHGVKLAASDVEAGGS